MALESVRKVVHFEQSLRSMRRILVTPRSALPLTKAGGVGMPQVALTISRLPSSPRPDDILADSHGEAARSSRDQPSRQFIVCANRGLIRNVDVRANNPRTLTDAMLFPVQPSMLE